MTPDAYMALLLDRMREWTDTHTHAPGYPPLLEWFVRDGDEHLVDMDAIRAANDATTDQPRPAAKPRRYRTAAELRDKRDRLAARRDALADIALPDRAAATGQGIGRKRAIRYAARMDSRLRRYVELDVKVRALEDKIRRAEAREARA